jgi:hypothetical protein
MEDDLKNCLKKGTQQNKNWKTISNQMEDDLKKIKNGRRPQKINNMEDDLKKYKKWKTTPKNKMKEKTTKINLIGCDTIVNSPSLFCPVYLTALPRALTLYLTLSA